MASSSARYSLSIVLLALVALLQGAYATSCNGKCGGSAGGCFCDELCTSYGDCCSDYAAFCLSPNPSPSPSPSPAGSCSGKCGGESNGCFCDELCTSFDDCCSDFATLCPPPSPSPAGSCNGKCGGESNGCFCDASCTSFNDCCGDYVSVCVCPNGDCDQDLCDKVLEESPELCYLDPASATPEMALYSKIISKACPSECGLCI